MKTLLSLGACLAFIPLQAFALGVHVSPPHVTVPSTASVTTATSSQVPAKPTLASPTVTSPVPIAPPTLGSTPIGPIAAPAKEVCRCYCYLTRPGHATTITT